MLYDKSEEELRSISKISIENLEKWAKYLISREMTLQYGDDFFYKQNENGDYIINKEIRSHVEKMLADNNKRFSNKVDILFLDDIISILCKEELYKNCFKKCLDIVYPEGRMEANTFLSRIKAIRNKLYHSNSVSYREVEQAVCYSNDFVDGVKKYMNEQGESKKYNVPNIVRINDSLGNEFYPNNRKINEIIYIGSQKNKHEFNCGEDYSIWVTMDPTFEPNEYVVEWDINGSKTKGLKLNYIFSEEDVSETAFIRIRIVSNKKWHKYKFYDQSVSLAFRVLPPM